MSATLAPLPAHGTPVGDSSTAVPNNVPTALSSLVGRTREVAELTAALDRTRMLTVIGPGGAGKTRLAREVAARETGVRYPDGVWWVELAPVNDGADVPATLAAVLGVNPSPGRRLDDALGEALRGPLGYPRRLLVVLDNCEHVVDEAAALAEALLRAAPGLTVLATSREALAVEGEMAWPVPPLARPPVTLAGGPAAGGPAAGAARPGAASAAATGAYEAVQLFVERARAAAPGFTLTDANAAAVASICARLDGLPLALELAAAVVPVLGVDALAARLDDALALLARGRRTALPRHRTLRAVLDWSYELLGDDERALLRRLSVFRGSFALDAVEAVCAPAAHAGAAGRRADVVPALGRLVEHSLVEVREEDGDARYRLLETVRQYGAALLHGTPDEREVRARHAGWVARTAAAAEPLLFSPARGRTVVRLQHEIDEIRAALSWASRVEHGRTVGEPMTGIRLAGALGWFWFSGVPWEEARALLRAALAAADAEGIADADRPLADRVALGTLLYPLTGLHYFAGDPGGMLELLTRELALWDTVDADPALATDPALRLSAARGRGLAHQLRGLALAMQGAYAAAVPEMDRSLVVVQAAGDAWLHAVLTMRRALVHLMGREHARADADYRAAVPALRALGETWFLSLTHEGMAANALLTGDLATAAREARAAVQVLREERDAWFASRGLDTLAAVLAARDAAVPDPALAATAAHLLGTAEALRRRCGASVIGHDRERDIAVTAALRARLGDSAFADAHAAGEATTLDDVFALVDDDARFAAVGGAADAAADTPPMAPAARGGTGVPADAPPARAATSAAEGAAEPHALRIDVLGPFAMSRDDRLVAGGALPTGKVRELLLYLLLHEQGTKDAVGLALWPDASPARVRNTFHVTLHHLRRVLGDQRWIAFEGNAYRLDRAPAPGVVLDADVDAVLAASTTLRTAARRHETPDAATLDALHAALRRARGDLATGVAAEDWIVAHQDRVRAAWADGMDALARLYALAGRPADTLAVCLALVAREPLREGTHRMLMEAHAALGEPARALAHYEALSAMLAREVGARPARETQVLAERLAR